MSMIDQTLSRIDLLGIPIILNFSKAKKVRSSFGGLWTLAFLAFVLWLLWSNGAELWEKKKPTVNQGIKFSADPRPMELDSGTFPMMVYIQYYSTGPTDPANNVVCDFSYLLQTSSDSNGVNGTWIDMELCTKEHFADFVEDGGIIDSETEDRITYSYCLPEKSYGSVYGFSLSVSCDDQTGIDEFFDDDPTIEIYYPKYGLSLQNYSYPIQPYLFNYETGIKQEITTYSYWNINYLDITTDHGWLATSEKTEHFVQVSPALNPEVALSGWNENIFIFSISQEEIYYTRTYTKIQNVLAAVGGLAGSILAVLLIVITPYARVKLSEAFLNEMFELRAGQEQVAQTPEQNGQKSEMNTAKVANYSNIDADGVRKDNIQSIEMANRDGKDQESSPFMKSQSPVASVDQYKNAETAIHKDFENVQIDPELAPIQSPSKTGGNGEKNDIEAQQQDFGRNANQVIAEEQKRRLEKGGVFGTMQLALPAKPKKIKKEKIISITFCEYLASLVPFVYKSAPLKAKMKIINEGLEMLDNRLDVFNLMKKMRDIDKMKGLLLNKEQSLLFDRASRPNIKNRSNHWYQEDYGTDHEIFKNANQLEELEMQALIKETQRMIQDKPQKSEVDLKLLEVL